MELDVVMLSRLQFALTIMFHYLFPPLTIGMGIVLVYLDGMWWKTGDLAYEKAAKFWTKVFALNFAIGVATGIVMEFEFGTNWATYSRFVGDVFGSALAAEGIFAFFLESGFLAVLVFGWDRVSKPIHFLSTCMVALGSIFSSVWIVVANSWQQTPAGSHIVPIMRDGQPWVVQGEVMMRAEVVDFWAMVLNPSTVHRLSHTLLGCFVMGAFFIISISSWYMLKNRHEDFARRSIKGAIILATVSSIALAFGGHLQAQNVYEHQPAKIAAFEGHYETGQGPASLTLFGIPDDKNQKLHAKVAVPGALSFLVHDNFTEPVMGLNEFRPEHRPPTLIPFITFRLMVGIGTFFIILCLYACWRMWRGTLFDSRWLLWVFVFCAFPALVANQSGWIAAEVGRQPWIVHPVVERDAQGVPVRDADGYVAYETVTTPAGKTMIGGLMTTNAVSTAIKSQQVLRSIIMFGLLYTLLGSLWIFLLITKIQHGPEPVEAGHNEHDKGFFKVAGEHSGEKLTEHKQAPASQNEKQSMLPDKTHDKPEAREEQ